MSANDHGVIARFIKVLRETRTDPILSNFHATADASPLNAGGEEFAELMKTLDRFSTTVSYLNGRRPSSQFVKLDSEADVQDLLFVMLKPRFPKLSYEAPTPKGAVGYSIADFALPEMSLIIEAKYIESRARVKTVSDEIAEDIYKYAIQTTCERIVFFVYDPFLVIPDRDAFIATYTEPDYSVRGRRIQIISVIKP